MERSMWLRILSLAIIIAKDAKVKDSDKSGSMMATLENILTYTDCDFGCWTNG